MSTIKTNNIQHVDATSANIALDSSGNVTLANNLTVDTNTLFVDGTNNRVGVGTTNPGAALHVVRATSKDQLRLGTGTTEQYQIGRDGSTGYLWFYGTEAGYTGYVFDGANGERARIDSSGRLLVGTSTARSNLEFGGSTGTPTVQIETATQGFNSGLSVINNSSLGHGGRIWIGASYGNSIGGNVRVDYPETYGVLSFVANDGTGFKEGARIAASTDAGTGTGDVPSRLVFSTTADSASSPTERMRITNDGKVLINQVTARGAQTTVTSSASTTIGLDVNCSDSGFAQMALNINVNRATTGSSYGFLRCIQQDTTTKLHILDSGTVQNSTGTYNTISDAKLKENIVDAPSQWDDIKNIRIRHYNFKLDTNQPTHRQIGVIAQELELVSPGLVEEVPDWDGEGNDLGTTTKGVKSSILYMKAVKALQEAMERIETLESEVAVLKATINP